MKKSDDANLPDWGSVNTARTVKAGCGIRYDMEQLGEETEFDFSAAAQLKASLLDETSDAVDCDPSAEKKC